MKKIAIAAAVPAAILFAACGVDNRAPAAEPTVSATPVPASATPTNTPAPTPTAAQASPEADQGCIVARGPAYERVEEWPDNEDAFAAIVNAFPWDVPGLPDDVPMDPEYDLLDGMDVPLDITGGGPVTFNLIAENSYDETISFALRGDPAYDFAVISPAGELVWMYSDNIEAEAGPDFLELEPGDSRDMSATWDLTGPDGAQVKDGLYFVAGIIFREDPHVEMAEQFVYIGERPSLEKSLEVRLTAPSEVKCGRSVPMTLEVTNVTDSPIWIYTGVDFDNYFTFTSGDESEREELWNWWAGQAQIQPLLIRWLPPGETATFTRSWELQDHSGKHVTPGTYQLQARIHAAQLDDIPDSYETVWSNIVELTVTE